MILGADGSETAVPARPEGSARRPVWDLVAARLPDRANGSSGRAYPAGGSPVRWPDGTDPVPPPAATQVIGISKDEMPARPAARR